MPIRKKLWHFEENFEWFDNEIEENAEHIYDILSNNIENTSSSNRPLVYLGNSRTTKYRKKIEAKKNAEKNSQTLVNFFANNTIDDKIKQKDNCLNLAIDQIEFKLNTENLTPRYKVCLKAVQKYLILNMEKLKPVK